MKQPSRIALALALALAASGLIAFAPQAHAVITLVDSDFEAPGYSSGTQLENPPGFPGWTFRPKSEGGTLYPKARNHPGRGDVPVAGNQLAQFEYPSAPYIRSSLAQWADHDTGNHAWSSGDVYTLKFNASPQSWNGSQDRYIRPSLLQQDGTVLWESPEDATTKLPAYNSFGGQPWTPEQTFEFTIDASTFTAGTEGEPLMLRMGSSGFRGVYFDNVSLTLPEVIPEPSTTGLLGLAAFAMIFRRRR